MSDIYDQHRAAFANVAAYVILDNNTGERVATIAFKFPRDGAGRLYAYIHWFGTEMVRGYAGGFGYDKRTAACASAARHLSDKVAVPFADAIGRDDGYGWDHHLQNAGFTVLQAV